jgi:predicted nucleotidyltransferase
VTIAPVDELARRIVVAEAMADRYAAADGVAAVLLAGSVARGLADARSDVEVDVYWRRPPSDAERRAVVDDAGWEWVYAEVDEHEWADGVRLDGVKVDVSQFVTATIDGYLDALREGDTEPELQVRATALLDGRALAGDGLIEDWRARLAPYPEALALAMLDQALPPRPVERLEMLVARDDPVLLTRDVVEGVHAVLDALFAVNRKYVPHPFHKWLAFECAQLDLAPPDLEARIRRVLAVPREGVPDLVRLTEETFDFVAAHVPAYDVAAARAEFASSLRG